MKSIRYRVVPILDDLKCLVKRNLFFIILFAAFYFIGMIIGISIAVKAEDAKASLMAINWLMGNYAIKNMNLFLFFLLHLLLLAIVALIFAFVSFKVYFSFVYFLVFIYMGMSCGGAIVLLFAIFGISSLVIDILGFVIFELAFTAYFILYASYMFEIAIENHRFGCNCGFRQLMKPFLQQFILLAALLIIQTFLLFLCSVFIL